MLQTNKGSACKALPPDFTTQAALLYNKASEYCNNKQIHICTFVGKYIYLIYSSAYSLYFIWIYVHLIWSSLVLKYGNTDFVLLCHSFCSLKENWYSVLLFFVDRTWLYIISVLLSQLFSRQIWLISKLNSGQNQLCSYCNLKGFRICICLEATT